MFPCGKPPVYHATWRWKERLLQASTCTTNNHPSTLRVPAAIDPQEGVEAGVVRLEVLGQPLAQPRIHPGEVGIVAVLLKVLLSQSRFRFLQVQESRHLFESRERVGI